MAHPFRVSHGHIELRLEPAEAELIEQLCGDLLERLGEVDDVSLLDDDPVLGRLFPDGYRDDPEAAAELRSLIQSDLRVAKVSSAKTVLRTITGSSGKGRSKLTSDEAAAWLATLNDLRLALGTILDITEDDDPRFDPARHDGESADEDDFTMSVYLFLGWLQSSLVDALD